MRRAIVLAALIVAMSPLTSSAQVDRPNIVLVFMDNFGWGELGTYGGGVLRGAPTPRIDSLAEDGLKLTARAAEVGEAHVTLDIEYEGEPAEIAFNPAYVLDGLNVIEDENVTFEFRNPSSPSKMTDGDEFTYVVMPISIE